MAEDETGPMPPDKTNDERSAFLSLLNEHFEKAPKEWLWIHEQYQQFFDALKDLQNHRKDNDAEKGGKSTAAGDQNKNIPATPPQVPKATVRSFLRKHLRIHNDYIRVFLAEFLATFTLLALGDGSVAQTVLSARESFQRGNIVTIMFGYGLGVTMGIFIAGGISGGHMNPAFSFVCALMGKTPWKKLPFYLCGQYLGAFFGSMSVFVVYHDRILIYESACQNASKVVEGACATAGIFATYPSSPEISTLQGFADQIFGTMLLVMLALAITDTSNMNVPDWAHPHMVGLIVMALVAGFEYNCGAALNPARDLGPRIFTLIAGWGDETFSLRNYNWFWVPIVGPHLGALLGAAMYLIFINLHLPQKHERSHQLHRRNTICMHEGKEFN